MSKLTSLKQVENKHRNDVLAKPVGPSDDTEQLKFFCTFPFPYMNGSLHLGHALTMMSCELQKRFREANGQNVLFPFGFHGSGMPIVAAAKKLQDEIIKYDYVNIIKNNDNDKFEQLLTELKMDNWIKILLYMRVKREDIIKFEDPTFWVPYFSEAAKTDLADFNLSADFTRSFYTTDANPYFDSFVRWQFVYLLERGYVYKGKRNTIYSMLDKQACADHDRQTGEKVKPVISNTIFVQSNVGIILLTIKHFPNYFSIICTSKKIVQFVFEGNSRVYVCNENAYNNISHQFNTIKIGETDVDNIQIDNPYQITYVPDFKQVLGTGFYGVESVEKRLKKCETTIENNTDPSNTIKYDFTYEEPGEQVVSRSGDICIVASIDQWLINYKDDSIRLPVKEYIGNTLQLQSESVRKLFDYYVDWLDEWPCSRNYGLGTCIPGTSDLIDSLSDSTIYMAFYTICHLVVKLPIELVTKELWDYIFFAKNDEPGYSVGNEKYDDIIKSMKKEFNYWYPLDLRVSGKDLVGNHLTMALLNHQAIWQDHKYLPRQYFINGYLLLNGEKMSKSTGNFMTIRDALDAYGANATRLALVNSFVEGTNDGNFETACAEASIFKLFTELEFVKEYASVYVASDMTGNIADDLINTIIESRDIIWDKVFDCEIDECLKSAYNSYISQSYRGISMSFEALVSSRNAYVKVMKEINIKTSNVLINKFFVALVTIMDPVCPTWTAEIRDILSNIVDALPNWNIIFDKKINKFKTNENTKFLYYKNVLYDVFSECSKIINKHYQKNKNLDDVALKICIFSGYTDEEKEIINNYQNIDEYLTTIPKQKYGMYKAFVAHMRKKISEYGDNWKTWIIDNDVGINEFNIIRDNLERMIKVPCDISIIEPSDRSKFKAGPGYPIVSIKK